MEFPEGHYQMKAFKYYNGHYVFTARLIVYIVSIVSGVPKITVRFGGLPERHRIQHIVIFMA